MKLEAREAFEQVVEGIRDDEDHEIVCDEREGESDYRDAEGEAVVRLRTGEGENREDKHEKEAGVIGHRGGHLPSRDGSEMEAEVIVEEGFENGRVARGVDDLAQDRAGGGLIGQEISLAGEEGFLGDDDQKRRGEAGQEKEERPEDGAAREAGGDGDGEEEREADDEAFVFRECGAAGEEAGQGKER